MQFKLIHNPNALILKNEVWYSGTSDLVDSYGQRCGSQTQARIAASFLTRSRAEGFIQYQTETRAFRGI